MNLSTEELFKQMEAGKLLSADVLPKVAKELRRTANSGGALEMRMKSMRVAQGRFFKQVESGADTIFTAGFDVGGGEMFNEMADQLDKSSSGMKGMGKVFQGVFKTIGSAAQFLIPILDSLFYVLGGITDALVELFQHKTGQIVGGIVAVRVAVMSLNGALGTTSGLLAGILRTMLTIVAPIVAAFAYIDEVMAKFDSSRTSMSENINGEQFDYRDVKASDLISFKNLIPTHGTSNVAALGMQAYDYFTGSGGNTQSQQTPVNVTVAIDGIDSRLQKELRTAIGLSSVEGRQ